MRVFYQRFQLNIDDGTDTPLEFKGDGIKSLVALSLFKHQSDDAIDTVFAIEEPESHLHSGAMYELRETLSKLSETSQVIITTHNPVFVRNEDNSNIVLIENGKAAPTKDIRKVRDCLGVRVSENLSNADFVLLVEGPTDEKILASILCHKEPKLRNVLNNGSMRFEQLGGGTNVGYKVTDLRSKMFKFHVVLDNENVLQGKIKSLLDEKQIFDREYSFVRIPKFSESEIEDVFDEDAIRDEVLEHFAVDLKLQHHSWKHLRWSVRMKNVFESQGKIWNAGQESRLKWHLAYLCSADPEMYMAETKTSFLDGLLALIRKNFNIV